MWTGTVQTCQYLRQRGVLILTYEIFPSLADENYLEKSEGKEENERIKKELCIRWPGEVQDSSYLS